MERTLVVILVVVTSAVVLVLGGIIAHLAYQAYSRTGSRVLGFVAAGFALVAIGILIGSGLQYAVGMSFLAVILVQRILTAIGYGLLVYSLYTTRPDGRHGAR